MSRVADRPSGGASQKARKQQEGVVVRRLTIGAGGAALALAWYFTSSAVTAVPIAFGEQSGADAQPVVGVEQLDDHVFVRTVHVPAPRPPAGGVRGTSGQPAAASATAAPSTGSAPIAQPVAAAPPPPAPVATTGGSTPKKS